MHKTATELRLSRCFFLAIVSGIDPVLFEFSEKGLFRDIGMKSCLIDASFERLESTDQKLSLKLFFVSLKIEPIDIQSKSFSLRNWNSYGTSRGNRKTSNWRYYRLVVILEVAGDRWRVKPAIVWA
jgi:hypothetical protein